MRGTAARRRVTAPCACVATCRVEVGLPTFRPHRPDRSEPSQNAPPLPVARTTRLGPSARRRAESPAELLASASRAASLIVRSAGRAVRAESSALSRGAE